MSDPEMLSLLRSIDGRLGGVESRLGGVEARLDAVETRLKRWKQLRRVRPTCDYSAIKWRR